MSSVKNKFAIGGGLSATILAIVAAVFATEGGYVNNPKDPGGETNHGITIAVARDNGYTGLMKDLPKEFAQEIYIESYIVKPGFLPIVEQQPALAHKLIDAGVNVGTSRSSRWFQQSLNALSRGGKDFPQINPDGKVGPVTVRTYESLVKVRGKVKACELSLKLLDAYQAMHYVGLNMHDFTVGWVDHRIQNVPLTKCKDFGP